MTIIPNIALSIEGCEYLLPYFERQFPMPESGDPPAPAAGIKIDVGAPTPDPAFDSYCQERGLPAATICCPSVVCTGMAGLPRRIAEGIYKGTFCLIEGCQARISVVHAIDVAAAAALAAGTQGSYTLTDLADPTITELALALAYRIDNKRLLTIKPWIARCWYGKEFYAQLTTDHLAAPTFQQAFPEFIPHPVVSYLRTHVYDEDSL